MDCDQFLFQKIIIMNTVTGALGVDEVGQCFRSHFGF